LTAAEFLVDRGCDVQVFDKARGPGGRMSTRREDLLEFDHGAQFFTVHSESFAEAVGRWKRRDVVDRWNGKVVVLREGGEEDITTGIARHVGKPGMNGICRHIASYLQVRFDTRILGARLSKGKWQLTGDGDSEHGAYDGLIVSTPPAQAVPLLADAPAFAARAKSAVMSPCWAAMVSFDERVPVDWDAAVIHGSLLLWAARNSSKPGRPAGETWILHGTHAWSQEHIALDPERAAALLLSAFRTTIAKPSLGHHFLKAHRWRYANADRPLDDGPLWNAESRVGVCGDWCMGNRIENAYLSGLQLARAIMESLEMRK
jgi:predicted NAD/FAD-dependent oxidoreductase